MTSVGPTLRTTPPGDNRERLVCEDCGYVLYDNPKIVTGAVCVWEDKFLLCRRAIEPRYGYWTLPAGYMELQESTSEGAAREALEEANARIQVGAMIALYNLPRLGQVHIFYRAQLLDPEVSPGSESLEVALYRWEEIPWAELAFPAIKWALYHYREVADLEDFAPRSVPPEQIQGGW